MTLAVTLHRLEAKDKRQKGQRGGDKWNGNKGRKERMKNEPKDLFTE